MLRVQHMYSLSLILVSTTLMLHEYLSFIPGSNIPNLYYCNKCAYDVSCGHDETFMFSDNLIRTHKGVTNALMHVRSERMKKVLNTSKTYLPNTHVLGCKCAYSQCMHVHGYHIVNFKAQNPCKKMPLSSNHIFVSVLDHQSYYTLIMP